ncbi:serine/threonine protein kinase [Myxococcota bacterium]|nr:serine/threonine protein kinase [Myxococcota bacterium]
MPVAKLGDQVDRYVLESVLGHGGMATVYLARHVELRSTHAIKILHLANETLRARALLEARSQATIRHPNVVAVTDLLRLSDGAPALVMELIDGPSLAALLKRGPLPIEVAEGIAVGILRGLGAAHKAGLIHRDLKATNVLLDIRQGYAVAKIADFGLVKAASADQSEGAGTRSGALLGTPGAMAPEQARDPREVDDRADLFSAGVILYHMVTGEPPYPTHDAIESYLRANEGRRAPVATLRPELPRRWVDTINAALDPDPSMRPESADAMLRLLLSDGEASSTVELTGWSAELLDTAWSLRPSASLRPDDDSPASSISAPSLAPQHERPRPAEPQPAPPPPKERGLGERTWQLATALALLVTVTLLVTQERAPTPVAAPAPPVEAPAEPTIVQPEEAPPPAPVEAPKPRPKADPAPKPPAPKPAEPAPVEPAAPAAPPPTVVVESPVRVILESQEGKMYTAGAVPNGEYTVYAYFDGTMPTRVLTVTVDEKRPLRLVCDDALKVCARR